MKHQRSILAIGLVFCWVANAKAQQPKKPDSVALKPPVKKEAETRNVMLNASDNTGPRNVNIGLPASVGGTTILENGLPVVYTFATQSPISIWRSEAMLSKLKVMDLAETSLTIGEVGVSVDSYTNKGTEKFQVKGALNSNHFGLLRGDINLSGPIKNGFYYSVSAYANYDPGTFKIGFANFVDETQIYRAVLNKKYNKGKGEIGIQLKYANSYSLNMKQSPYYYRENGKVDALDNFKIGTDSYIEKSGILNYINPLNGNLETKNMLKDFGSSAKIIEVFGKNVLDHNLNLNYIIRYHNGEGGSYSPYLNAISPAAVSTIKDGITTKTRYLLPSEDGKPTQIYNGQYAQSVLAIISPRSNNQAIQSRVELSKKSKNHNWKLGFNEWFYKIDDATNATYSYYQSVENQPSKLLQQKSTDGGLTWKNSGDQFGNALYNAGMQYSSGTENKIAFYGSDVWKISDKFTLNVGARIEWQHMDGEWAPAALRTTNYITNKQAIKKNWYNKALAVSAIYKLTKTYGLLTDLGYTDMAGGLSSYSGADDPDIKQQKVPNVGFGFYYNNPMIGIVSKATYIQRDNFKNNSTYVNPSNPSENTRQTISYTVQTLGWTTDVMFTPGKNFSVHALLTLQNPKYKDYNFTVYGINYSFDGNIARSVSKTLIELDPSYSFMKNKLRVWASGRYFSNEFANYTNSLFFKGRWETFAGVDYKSTKNLTFNVNVINVLSQSGAQGSISGTNTITDPVPYYNKAVAGTYIRPFTVEMGVKFKY